MIRRALFLVMLVAAGLACAAPAHAQILGVRAGVSADPDQFFIGGHIETPRLGEAKKASLRPNLEIGFGDDTTVVAGNLELVYWVPLPDSTWQLYFGGGPAVNYIHNDFDDHAHGGFNMLVGFQAASGLFIEMKVGVQNSPGLKGTVGYVFKGN